MTLIVPCKHLSTRIPFERYIICEQPLVYLGPYDNRITIRDDRCAHRQTHRPHCPSSVGKTVVHSATQRCEVA